jgi:NADH:ubiquinone oxidoreductase subunit 4 (subunit M)
MVSLWGFITLPLQKTLQVIHDPIQQARIKMFYYVFLLNFIKIIALVPVAIFQNNPKKLVVCALGVVMTAVIVRNLLAKPQYLNRIIHLGLATGIFFLLVPAFFSKQPRLF